MRKNTKKYKRELAAAKADIKRLLTEEHLPCEFCRYEAQMDVPCTQGDKEWCRQHAVWKGDKQLNQNLLEDVKKKNGIHGNREQIDELSVNRILGELYDKAKAENDGKVHIREIEDGHVGDTIELY